MSFCAEVKQELARFQPAASCCQAAELAALLYLDTSLSLGRKNLALSLATESAAVARKFYGLSKSYFYVKAEVSVTRRRQLRSGFVYRVELPLIPEVQAGLKNLGLELGHLHLADIPARLLATECCRRAYLRGAFLGAGSLNDPHGSYHLEMVARAPQRLEMVARLMREYGLHPGITRRKGQYVVYLKDGAQIAELLGLMAAHASLLRWENIRVMKEMRGQVNRLVNCDTANLDKSVKAALRQTDKITYLADCLGLDRLPEHLRQVAELRLAYPEASLRELGQLLDPKVGKSGVNYRLRRLEEMADRLQVRDSG